MELIGPHPFELDAQGNQKTRIGTLFLDCGFLYTAPPCVHAWQRMAFIERLNANRSATGHPALTLEDEERLCANSVDLIFDPDHVLIRPNPDRMDLAFAADELLLGIVAKRQIQFLSVSDARVREAIKRHGECWRLSSIPKSFEGKKRIVSNSRVGITGLPIYYYNRLTGTRWLTYQEFEGLGQLDDGTLARHLQEITDHSAGRNRQGRPELDFFAADLRRFGARHFSGAVYEQLAPEALRARYQELKDHFRSAAHESFRQDDYGNRPWIERMLSTLFLEGNEAQTEQILSGLSPEFFLQVEWLAGGRFETGEFIFDSIFDEAEQHPEDAALQALCDSRAKGIIFNLIREYGDLEYINVGKVPESLSLIRPQTLGRRGVYLVEFKSTSTTEPIKQFIRLQKWGVWEHLDEGHDLLQSIEESEEYTDFCLDRRLGCRQLGMVLPGRVIKRRLTERYTGTQERYRNQRIRTTYFERDYIQGIATDKLPTDRYSRPGYALSLASLLGRAAAASMIVGRSLNLGKDPAFDDGDEVVLEDAHGLPDRILVGDHSGAFGEYRLPLDTFASHYARPVNTRDRFLPQPREFAFAYLGAFHSWLSHIQADYRKRRRAFDTLFKHCNYDVGGSFAYRWECALRRLDQTDPDQLVSAIRKHIYVLNQDRSATVSPTTTPPTP
jgi:hypothetical protein